MLPSVCGIRYRVVGHHLCVSSDDRYVLCLFQLSERSSSRLITYVTILTKTDRDGSVYRIRRTHPFSEIKTLICCKRFAENGIKVRNGRIFVIGDADGYT